MYKNCSFMQKSFLKPHTQTRKFPSGCDAQWTGKTN